GGHAVRTSVRVPLARCADTDTTRTAMSRSIHITLGSVARAGRGVFGLGGAGSVGRHGRSQLGDVVLGPCWVWGVMRWTGRVGWGGRLGGPRLPGLPGWLCLLRPLGVLPGLLGRLGLGSG